MSWYVVESHLGGLSFRGTEPDPDALYCEQCGDSDTVFGPVDPADADDVLELAWNIGGMYGGRLPLPWDGDPYGWFRDVEANLRRIARESPVPVDVAGLMRRLRRDIDGFWWSNGLLPFDRRRCVSWWMGETRAWMSVGFPLGRRESDKAAGRLLAGDWSVWPEGVEGPVVPTPWLGCMLEARMRVLPGYRRAWLDLLDGNPGWGFDAMTDDDSKPVAVPLRSGGVLPVRFMVPSWPGAWMPCRRRYRRLVPCRMGKETTYGYGRIDRLA